MTSQALNNQHAFLLNGEILSGVSNVSLGYSNPLENSPSLGNANFGFLLNGSIEGFVDFSRQLIYQDPVLRFTGDSSFGGEFIYNNKAYSFESGYLTSYGVSCGVGQVPQVDARVSVWGGLRSGQSVYNANLGEGIFIPSPKSISVSGLDFASNRVQSFNYSISIARQPIYSLEGGRAAQSVNFVPPIEITASIDLEVSNSDMRDSYSIVEKNFDDTVVIQVKDRGLQNSLALFTVYNARLLGETLSSNADGQPVKNLTFGGLLS